MKILQCLILLFLLTPALNAQVYVDSADVKSEFCGPFNKTTVVLKIVNDFVANDSLNGSFIITTNKSAFVKEMWLDINGTYQRALNLGRYTAERIYERIVRRRIDPAKLVKLVDGSFYLEVFPVNRKQPRYVKIEFYSLIELNNSFEHYGWNFAVIPSKNMTVNYKFSLPEGVIVKDNKGRELDINPQNKGLEYECTGTFYPGYKTETSLDFDKLKKDIVLYNSQSSFRVYYNSDKYGSYFLLPDPIYNVPEYFNAVVKYGKEGYDKLISEFWLNDDFLPAFQQYMQEYKNIKIKLNIQNELPKPGQQRDFFVFKNIYMSNFIKPAFIPGNRSAGKKSGDLKIKCPYLHEIENYLYELSQDSLAYDKYKFLSVNSSKLVLEDNDFTQGIYDAEIYREKKSGAAGLGDRWDYEEAFSYVEEMPSHPFGQERLLKFLKENILYPEIARRAQVEGKVLVGFVVEKDGTTRDFKIYKGIGADCDEEALRIVKMLGNWRPGRESRLPVSIRMVIPVEFRLSNESLNNGKVKYIQKLFSRQGDRMLIEEGFDFENALKVNYLSKEFFDILYDNPDLIDYVFYLKKVGLFDQVSKKWVLFQ